MSTELAVAFVLGGLVALYVHFHRELRKTRDFQRETDRTLTSTLSLLRGSFMALTDEVARLRSNQKSVEAITRIRGPVHYGPTGPVGSVIGGPRPVPPHGPTRPVSHTSEPYPHWLYTTPYDSGSHSSHHHDSGSSSHSSFDSHDGGSCGGSDGGGGGGCD
jgi:hypothetical protein